MIEMRVYTKREEIIFIVERRERRGM